MNWYNEEFNITKLIGKTIEKVEESKDKIIFRCGDESYNLYHMQDCCETVLVYDIIGDIRSLEGQEVLAATVDNDDMCEYYSYAPYDSYTWTTFSLTTRNGVVKIVWLGESNGYYSESVYFGITH